MLSTNGVQIPILHVGQKVSEWRHLFEASVSLVSKETDRVKMLPLAVNRSGADRAWAVRAAKQTTLKAALDELETRLDGEPSRWTLATDFYKLAPTQPLKPSNLGDFFFAVLDTGVAAKVPYDLIAIKFLEYLPGGQKFYSDLKQKIDAAQSEAAVIEVYDHICKAPIKWEASAGVKIKAEVFKVDSKEEDMPAWASRFLEQVGGVKAKKYRPETTDSSTETSDDQVLIAKPGAAHRECSVCGKKNHVAEKCYKRKCANCSGLGHDAGKCPSKPRRRKR